jgi:hypothetical protein
VTPDDFEAQLQAVEWTRFETAYGSAAEVADQFRTDLAL